MLWPLPSTSETGFTPCTDPKSGGTWDVAGQPCLTAIQKKFKVKKVISQQPEPMGTGTVRTDTVVHICKPSCAIEA